MDKYTQALELCMAARIAYNTIRCSIRESYAKPILPLAEQAIEEPFKVLNIPPAQQKVIKQKCLRIEKQGLKPLLKKVSPLSIIYMIKYFLDYLNAKYLDIPENSKLWITAHNIFDALNDTVATDAEKMKANQDGQKLSKDIINYFQSKGLYI